MPGAKPDPITIRVSTKMLRQIDQRCQSVRAGLGTGSRQGVIMDALEASLAFGTVKPLKLDHPKPVKFTKAIADSTGHLKTGRYEP